MCYWLLSIDINKYWIINNNNVGIYVYIVIVPSHYLLIVFIIYINIIHNNMCTWWSLLSICHNIISCRCPLRSALCVPILYIILYTKQLIWFYIVTSIIIYKFTIQNSKVKRNILRYKIIKYTFIRAVT